MRSAIKVLQANLHHARGASATLCRIVCKDEIDLALVQEPWLIGGLVRGLSCGSCKLLYDRMGGAPRTAILINNSVRHFPLTNFIHRDLVATAIEVATADGVREVVIASAYFPGDVDEVPPAEVQRLVEFCRLHNKPLVIGCDANAHHTIWGSSDVNKRGESLLDYLLCCHLDIANVGCKPTFINSIREEVLDLTLISSSIASSLINWRVTDEATLSDHQHIRFDLPGQVEIRQNSFCPKKTNWELFKASVALKADMLISNPNSVSEIELAANLLQDVLITSFEASSVRKTLTVNRKVPWWNEELAAQRRKVKGLFNKARSSRISWDVYRDALTNYNKNIRRSKRDTWRSYCGSLESLPEAARLHKVLAKGSSNGIGLLKRADGSFTQDRREALELLLQVHFPGSVANPDLSSHVDATWSPDSRGTSLSGTIFDPEKVKWAVDSFAPFKAPGGDQIFPALLQNSLDHILDPLVGLLRASLTWGYIPNSWRRVNVVFIPKQGNRPLDQPKSYRPISLTSFLLKTAERLLDLHIRCSLQGNNPLHPTQFAYIAGRSTEVALHKLVSKIERAFVSKNIALCSFLDIEGAFDNTGYGSISTALERRNIARPIVRWIDAMLKHRIISSTLDTTTALISAVKGCPQGGVLSPLLWSLVVDELLIILAEQGVEAIGYADDLALVVNGNYANTVTELMQSALNTVSRWCVDVGLSINPQKAIIVPFTKRYSIDIGQLHIGGSPVELSNEVKYLGVTLDKRLNWNSHLHNTLSKATHAMWACRRLFGRIWGLKSCTIRWLFEMMVRPIVTYAAIVWWPKVTQVTAINKCTKLHRLLCLSLTGALRTCPTAAMESILNLTPLHIRIKEVAAMSLLRIKLQSGLLATESGHASLLKDIPGLEICTRSDSMTKELFFGAKFRTLIPDRRVWDAGNPIRDPNSIHWYTDGSKTEQGVGAGIHGPNSRTSIAMGNWPTVFQSEVHAIEFCCRLILEKGTRGAKIYIFSDSQAAILALSSKRVGSRMVADCWKCLQRLSLRNKVTLIWVPGHSGFQGNEVADELARAGSSSTLIGPEPFCGVGWSTISSLVKSWAGRLTERYWFFQPGMRQAKELTNPKVDRRTKQLSRRDLYLLVGYLSGHHLVNYHLNKMRLSSDAECRLCKEDDESTKHILCDCPALVWTRRKHLHAEIATPEQIVRSSTKDLLCFIREAEQLLS